MAVVEMSKLNLVAMSYDKDAVLNALHRTGSAEIKLCSQTEYANPAEADTEELRAYLSRLEGALGQLCGASENYFKGEKIKTDYFGEPQISYAEFMSAGEKREIAEKTADDVASAAENKRQLEAELAKVRRDLATARLYSDYKEPLKQTDTAHVRFMLGVLPVRQKDIFVRDIAGVLASYSFEDEDGESALILAAVHKCDAQKAVDVLQASGFSSCPFDTQSTGEELYLSLKERERELETAIASGRARWAELAERIRDLKIYCDYTAFCLEKAEADGNMRFTASAFLLEAYVPKEAEGLISRALDELSKPVYYGFSAPAEDETPPTLLKNNKIVRNFEAVTNMYSPPSSREFDPNTVMAFFYSVFLGFIMADMGYGIMMMLGGKHDKESGRCFRRRRNIYLNLGLFVQLVLRVCASSLQGNARFAGRADELVACGHTRSRAFDSQYDYRRRPAGRGLCVQSRAVLAQGTDSGRYFRRACMGGILRRRRACDSRLRRGVQPFNFTACGRNYGGRQPSYGGAYRGQKGKASRQIH